MMHARWSVIVEPGGKVIGVAGGAPEDWIGQPAATIEGIAEPAARALLALGVDGSCVTSTGKATVGDSAVTVDVLGVAVIAIEKKRADLRELVARAVAPFRTQAEARDVNLVVEAGDEPISVSVDDAKIVWIVATLVGNALRFARAGTRRQPGGTVRVIVTGHASKASVEVHDDGPGIDAERVRGLFERRHGENPAGVALRMARDVAIAHGGSLDVESSIDADDHFTRVRLTLASL